MLFSKRYMMDQNPNDKFHIRELSDTYKESLKRSSNPMKYVLEINASLLLDKWEPRHNGRIMRVPDWFMFLRKATSDELDLDPSSYNKTISDKNLGN